MKNLNTICENCDKAICEATCEAKKDFRITFEDELGHNEKILNGTQQDIWTWLMRCNYTILKVERISE